MKFIILLATLLSSQLAFSTPVSVFFAGGQSNAKVEWAEAIGSRLSESGRFENVLVVQTNSGGAWLNHWINASSAESTDAYKNDFFNEYGTGNLQAAMGGLAASGYTPIFRGFFWMQGESDSLSLDAINRYASDFNLLLNRINHDLGFTSERSFDVSIGVVSANPDATIPESLATAYPDRDLDAMRAAQFGMANDDLFMSATDTLGYARYDYWHMHSNSLVTLGQNMADDFLDLHPVPLPAGIWLLASGLLLLSRRSS